MPSPSATDSTPSEHVLAAAKASRRGALLLITGALLSGLSMPRNLLALVALLPALWFFGVAVRHQIRKAPAVMVAWTVLGLVLAGVLVFGLLLPYLFWDNTVAYQQCLDAANTSIATERCTQDFTGSMSPFAEGLLP